MSDKEVTVEDVTKAAQALVEAKRLHRGPTLRTLEENYRLYCRFADARDRLVHLTHRLIDQ